MSATTPTPAAPRHPDDPRPLDEQFDRTYPHGRVVPVWTALSELQASKGYAPWHRPLDRWWVGGRTFLPLALAPRWDAYREIGRAMLRRVA